MVATDGSILQRILKLFIFARLLQIGRCVFTVDFLDACCRGYLRKKMASILVDTFTHLRGLAIVLFWA